MKRKMFIFSVMRKYFVALLVVMSPFIMHAQQNPYQLQSYVFSTGSGTSALWLQPTSIYTSLASGNTAASATCDLGFPFVFEGCVYTQFSVNTDGTLRLGRVATGTASSTTPLNSTNSNVNTPKIIGLGGDFYGSKLTYGISGTAPNRVGVYTFSGYSQGSSSNTFTFQVQLYETTGEIRFVYGTAPPSNTTSKRFQIGIASSSSDVVCVNPSTHVKTSGYSSTTYNTWPGKYRYYSFVPTKMCSYPYDLSVHQNGQNSVTLDWSNYSGTSSNISYIVEYGPSGFAQGTGTKVPATSKPVVINGLMHDVEYTFYVRSVCDAIDTSLYSNAATYVICSNNNMCIDFTALNSPNVKCTYGKYQYYNNYSGNTYKGPYATVGIVDYGQDRYGSSSSPGSRHTVHTRQGDMDSCSGWKLSKIPPGECKSVRLGCVYGAYFCQAISYDLTVDTNVSDILLLKYACVFYNPKHPGDRQPRFVLEILDSTGSAIDYSCGQANFNATHAADSSWNQGIAANIYWKDWTPVGLYLGAFHGQTIKVRLTSFACGQGAVAHFGYAYYTLSCGKAKISSNSCIVGEPTTLSAPLGFNYRWYSSVDTTQVISTNRQLDVILDSNYYYCDVSFIDAPDCKFKMSYNHLRVSDTLRDTIRQVICPGGSYTINGDTLTAAGWYSQGLTTVRGCDSVLDINIAISDTVTDTSVYHFCAGSRFVVDNYTYPSHGVYPHILRDNSTGCYSKHMVSIVVADTLRDTNYRTICA